MTRNLNLNHQVLSQNLNQKRGKPNNKKENKESNKANQKKRKNQAQKSESLWIRQQIKIEIIEMTQILKKMME